MWYAGHMFGNGFHILLVCVALMAPAPLRADELCPPGRDISRDMDLLLSGVQTARSEGEAQIYMNQMWILWRRAPDAHAQELLNDGVDRIRMADFSGAQAVLSALIDYCPTYAEGYNQRAFSRFLAGEFEQALADLDVALGLWPRHLAAMTGRVLTLQALEREEEAQALLREALRLNPWLPERRLLIRPKGQAL